MKATEITRIIIIFLLGAVAMFLIQPWFYNNKLIRISDIPVNTWISEYYTTGAGIVFVASLLTTIFWTFMAAKARAKSANDISKWRLMWWLLLLLPIISIIIAIAFFKGSDDALLSFTGFLILDGIFLLYWLPTVTSSPGDLKYIPPGAFFIRRLIG
jgi:hypothetical protein